jgi:hypothetical protein
MVVERTFHFCLTCLRMSHVPARCHGQPMIRCDAGEPGDDQHPILISRSGARSLGQTRVFRWLAEETGVMPHVRSLFSQPDSTAFAWGQIPAGLPSEHGLLFVQPDRRLALAEA